MGSISRNYFGKEIRALKLFGVSITGDESFPYKVYSILLLVPTTFLYPLLNFYEYFKHDASFIAEIIVYQIGISLGFCKAAILLLNRVKFRTILYKLEQEPFTPNIDRGGNKEQELVEECVTLATKQTYIFWIFSGATLIAGISSTFTKMSSQDYHDWRMPFGPLTPFNATYFTGYEMNWLYQIISCTCICAQFITIDMILAAVLVHITYQFRVLQNVLKRLVETARKKMLSDSNMTYDHNSSNTFISDDSNNHHITWQYLRKAVEEAVKYHVAIIKISKEIEDVFSYLLLMVFLGTLIIISFSIFAASSARIQQDVVKHIIEALVGCVQVATICFWGEKVSQESQLVAKAAYESDFVCTDIKFQKMITLIIRRSQRPVKFSAGKFVDISLATYVWILRTSYSSFMVLRNRNL